MWRVLMQRVCDVYTQTKINKETPSIHHLHVREKSVI